MIEAQRAYPFFSHFIVDAADNNSWALRIARGEWFDRQVFTTDPLYPYFLGVLYRISGDSNVFARWIQISIGSLSCVLIAETARRLFDRKTAGVAGLMAAGYGFFIFCEGALLKETLTVFLTSAALLSLVAAGQNESALEWLASGFLLGLLSLTRGNALILFPLVAVWMIWRLRSGAFRRCVILTAGAILSLLPSTINNYVASGALVLTASKGGQNFAMGNNENADGLFQPFVLERQDTASIAQDAARIAESAEKRSLTAPEVDRYWLKQTLRFIQRNPARWAGLLLRKTRLFFSSYEYPDTEDYYLAATFSRILRLPLLNYGVLLPLGVLGMLLAARRSMAPGTELLYIFCIGNAVSVILFVIFARYRLPSVVPLIIFAASTMTACARWVKKKRFDRLALAAAGAAVLFVASYEANSEGLPGQVAESSWINLGDLYKDSGDFTAAESSLRKALRQRPDDYTALNDLGVLLSDQGRLNEALRIFQESLDINPAYANTYFYRALAFEAAGRDKAALADYSKTLQLSPRFSEADLRMANLLLKTGDPAAAEKYYLEAILADPGNSRAHYAFGLQLVRMNRLPRAIEEFRQAVLAQPDYSKAYDGLGVALLRAGDEPGAKNAFQEALRLDPQDEVARHNIQILPR